MNKADFLLFKCGSIPVQVRNIHAAPAHADHAVVSSAEGTAAGRGRRAGHGRTFQPGKQLAMGLNGPFAVCSRNTVSVQTFTRRMHSHVTSFFNLFNNNLY